MLKVINVISDSNIGGAGRMLLVFLKNYDRSKLEVKVLLPGGSLLINELEKMGINYLTDDGLAEKSFSVSSVNRLKKLFLMEKPDIVHTHASMSARIAARTAGCKVVYTRHSVFPNSRLKTSFPIKQLYGAINNYYADAVIAVSPAARDIIIEAGQSPGRVSVIYNGVDAQKRTESAGCAALRAEYGIDIDSFVCGIYARLTPVKGHEYVLEAARLLAGEKRIVFIIAGTGEIEEDLKRQASGLQNVIFTGFVDDVAKLMSITDVQLNASYGTEATSLSLLEGMSMGIPAVVTSFGGNPYVISDGVNGLVVPEKDSAAMADAIKKLYSDSVLYDKICGNSLKVFGERFTAEKMVRSIEELYAKMATQHS